MVRARTMNSAQNRFLRLVSPRLRATATEGTSSLLHHQLISQNRFQLFTIVDAGGSADVVCIASEVAKLI